MVVAIGATGTFGAVEGTVRTSAPPWLSLFGVTIKADGSIYIVGSKALLLISTDHGKTFSMKPVTPAGASQPIIQWTSHGGGQGTVFLVYQYKVGQTQGSSDIYLQRSTDAGKTWSQPARLRCVSTISPT